MRRVVVTGLGAITPIGNNVKDMWEAVQNGVCGIAPITLYPTEDRKVKLAGEVKNYQPEDYMEKRDAKKMDRFTQFAMIAADEAIEDSGINLEECDTDRCGIIVSSGIGGLSTIQREDCKGYEKGYDRVSPHFIPMSISNMAAGQIAIKYGLHGMASCVVTACAGGTNAIGDAFRHIRDGYAEVMLAGGCEASITELGIGGFTSLKALNETEDPNRASIPFDKKRNAKIYCEMAGYGANCDAHHITAPLEDGSMAAKCMKLAIEDAGMKESDIQYINAHGTSTIMNDQCETEAVKKAYGKWADKLMISSTKSMTGHLLGASGAVEGVITALSVKNDYVPATINYKVPDENCDLDIVPNQGRKATVNAAMSNSLGFGGHNASIIFRKWEE